MSARKQPSLPNKPFALLLVEGGDEEAVCSYVAGTHWATITCLRANGRRKLLPEIALIASKDQNFHFARSVGVVLDAEESVPDSILLATETLKNVGLGVTATHGTILAGHPRLGAFIAPDGTSKGSIESLCKLSIKDPAHGSCVDALVTCAKPAHSTVARAAKGWLEAYLGMMAEPSTRLHQAFEASDGLDASALVFDPLRTFLQSL
jgi:hypothetical protein